MNDELHDSRYIISIEDFEPEAKASVMLGGEEDSSPMCSEPALEYMKLLHLPTFPFMFGL